LQVVQFETIFASVCPVDLLVLHQVVERADLA